MSLTYSNELALGWCAKDFSLTGVDGNVYTLRDFQGHKAFLAVFMCNHCPYAEAVWPLMQRLYEKYSGDVAFAAINANDPSMYEEDSYVNMQTFARERHILFPYLFDETQEVAKAYQAQCTPDPYLFKTHAGESTLFYHGRFTDNWQMPESAKSQDLEDAIRLLITGGHPPTRQEPSMGCSIKWR